MSVHLSLHGWSALVVAALVFAVLKERLDRRSADPRQRPSRPYLPVDLDRPGAEEGIDFDFPLRAERKEQRPREADQGGNE